MAPERDDDRLIFDRQNRRFLALSAPVGRSATDERFLHFNMVLGIDAVPPRQSVSGSLDYAVSLDGPPLSSWRFRVKFGP